MESVSYYPSYSDSVLVAMFYKEEKSLCLQGQLNVAQVMIAHNRKMGNFHLYRHPLGISAASSLKSSRIPGIADPVLFGNPGRRSQRYGSLHSVSVDPKVVALSSPPKCGCDVAPAARLLQVAMFTKYCKKLLVVSAT